MHLVRRTHIDVSAETGNAASDADPPRLFELEEPFPVTNRSLTFHVASQAPPRRLHMRRPTAGSTYALTHASRSPASPDRFLDHPVRGGRLHDRNAFHRAAPPKPCGPGCGHPLGIRPHEQASSTLSPRPLPPSASTVRRVLPWLGRAAHQSFDQRGSAIRDAHDR